MGKKIFASRLKELRINKNISTRHLARMLGYKSASVIVDLESGAKFPSVEKLISVAKYFNVSIDWLLGLSSKRGVL